MDLVNSMYPLEYFGLAGVSRIKYPDQSWWSSHQRFASVDPNNPHLSLAPESGGAATSEYLEIDLGRIREINYLNFQIMRSPVDIFLYYDPVSSDDGTHEWQQVTLVPDMPFDNKVHFNPDARNAWFDAQFYFNNAGGDQVSTRFLRLRFKRRPHAWPTDKSNPFRWPISIKNLRSARFIATLKDTIGPLINTGAGDTEISLDVNPQNESYEIRQRFTMPDDYQREDINPVMMGFSFEAVVTVLGDGLNAPTTLDDVSWKWLLVDAASQKTLRVGVASGALNNNRAWIDVFFDPANPFQPDPTTVYELRLHSLNTDASDSVMVVSYSATSPLAGNFQATQIRANGTTITLPSQCLALRVWGDVAESGTDVLGNTYRYVTRRDDAGNVYNNNKVGWMCEPQPSVEAVESLYFDVRIPNPVNASQNVPSVIDAFQISPRTQGVRMHVYYTDGGLSGSRPVTRDDWDNMIWTPVNITYTLRGNQIVELPQTIRASYIKMEFSRLQPLPFRLPEFPKLPSKEYHRYPSWVEEQFQNTQFKRTVNDWFVKNLTPRRRRVLKELTDPVKEFQYKEREFLATLSTGDLSKRFANSQFVDIKDRALIDPVTGSKLFLDDGSLYKGTLTANVDRDSVLGQLVADRFDPTVPNTVVESVVSQQAPNAPRVSTSNDRISAAFAFLANTPMWFNRKCRHHYRVERASFNKQAFFVGVQQVSFFRKDYTTRRDDTLILDNLHDGQNLDENTFEFDAGSAIWRALPPYQTQNQQGLTLYVTYSINPTYTDEAVTFFAPAPSPGSKTSDISDASGVILQGTGGAAYNITVASEPNGQGTTYQPGVDYDIAYGLDPNTGETTNIITISTASNRVVASQFDRQDDAETVLSVAVISAVEEYILYVAPQFESAVVTGISQITSIDNAAYVDAATVTGIGGPRQSGFTDAATMIGVMDIPTVANSAEVYQHAGGNSFADAAIVTGISLVTSTDSHGFIDSATVVGIMSLTISSASNTTDFVDTSVPVVPSTSGSGISIRQGAVGIDAVDSSASYALAPDAHFQSLWIRWASLQPTGPADFSGWDTTLSGGHTLDDSFDDAKSNGYQIILRIACGSESPAWLYNTAVVGSPAVVRLRLIDTGGNGPIDVPLPFDAKLLSNYQAMLVLLAAKLHRTSATGLTAGGTRRSDFTYLVPVTMPTVTGSDMSAAYGAAATYLP